jgi:UDP-glucose 4-epimerase
VNILIIGSKGFIGSNSFKHLKTAHTVYGCDIFEADEEHYLQLDASSPDFNAIFSLHRYDVCINCSGAASVPWSITHPLQDFELNTLNVFKILDSISHHQPQCKFLNLSSAAVYGDPESLPIKETSLIKPLSPYGWHKYYAELVCKEFTQEKNIPTCSLRVFSAYGEGLKKQLFWDLYQKSKKENKVELFGTGNESRDFIYIGDLVRLIGLVINAAPFKGECINAANGEEVFLKDAVSMFYSIVDNNIQYIFPGGNREGDPLNWKADISFVRSLGYQPNYTFKDGLSNYFEWLNREEL